MTAGCPGNRRQKPPGWVEKSVGASRSTAALGKEHVGFGGIARNMDVLVAPVVALRPVNAGMTLEEHIAALERTPAQFLLSNGPEYRQALAYAAAGFDVAAAAPSASSTPVSGSQTVRPEYGAHCIGWLSAVGYSHSP